MKTITRGIIHGKTIELPEETGLPEGQEVAITLETVGPQEETMKAFRRSAGSWAEDAEDLDEYLEWNRQQRKASRPSLES